ncbi:type 2 lanthipeptide synthetase LanM family protein [uncultured Microbacterium sp.]|uniref:type 2 lanthipeptide synthetase LanM family protein n=1 Tax=uncultured Microbacterium sp. TaxID=191216 RepID=UPI0028D2970A|nr:type 2 lanthipeptide synthetase LanM family protein [uncultured Microbacterium sp.]
MSPVETLDRVERSLENVLSAADEPERAAAATVVADLLSAPAPRSLTNAEQTAVVDALRALGPTAGLVDLVDAVARALAGPESAEMLSHPVMDTDGRAPEHLRTHLRERAADAFGRVVVHLVDDFRAAQDAPHDAPAGFGPFIDWVTGAGRERLFTDHAHALAATRAALAASVRALREMLDRVEDDRVALAALTGGSDRARLSSLRVGAGDTHGSGRVVTVLEFDDGARAVYKPRSLAGDSAFVAVLQWVGRETGITLPSVRTLDRGGYGYAEFIDRIGDLPRTRARSYLRDVGSLLAILQALRANDMHFENIVMGPEGPVVIDGETLLTPVARHLPDYADGAASDIAGRTISQSVLGIGILPTVIGGANDDPGLDIGVLGFRGGQLSPFRSVVIRDAHSLDVHTVLARTEVSGDAPADTFSVLDAAEQRDAVRAGYRATVLALAQRADDLADVVARAFSGVRVRHVPAASALYRQILTLAHHPQAWSDRHLRAAVMSRVVLRRGDAADPALQASEAAQLAHGDIPHFTLRADSTLLTDSDGRTFPALIERSPIDNARDGISALVAELDAQNRAIDLAFVSSLSTDDDVTAWPESPSPGADDDEASAVARGILDDLVASVVRGTAPRFPSTWIDPQVTVPDQAQWSPGTLGYDLYGGAPGVALALAAGAAVFGDERYADVALSVLDPIARQFADGVIDELPFAVGGLTGAGSTAYALSVGHTLLGPDSFALDRAALLRVLGRGVGGPDQSWDLVSGTVGALAAALAVDDGTGTETVEAIARRVRAQSPLFDADTAYTGYAHGAVGAASVLLRAGAHLDDSGLAAAGSHLLRRVMSTRRETGWPRTFAADDRTAGHAWCHGSTGMLLAAAEAHAIDADLVSSAQLVELSRGVLAEGLGNNPTLCHGDAGTIDVLAYVGTVAPDLVADGRLVARLTPGLAAGAASAFVRARAGRRNRYGFVSSLMIGSAGTAWSLMRAQRPDLLPSVLGLHRPLLDEKAEPMHTHEEKEGTT